MYVDYILSIDPGRQKNGVAVVSGDKEVICQAVVETERLIGYIDDVLRTYKIKRLVIGNRTGGKALANKLTETGIARKAGGIASVCEDYSTEEGRRRYWMDHPPRGLRRLLPVTLQTPPRPIDDYVAVILAERYIDQLHKAH